jgi:hypothetical protein
VCEGQHLTKLTSYHAVFHLQRLWPVLSLRVKNLVWPPLAPNRHSQNADRTRNCIYMISGTTVDRRNDHREGILAKTIEEQTAKLPSDTFLWAAGGSIVASLTLKLIGRDKDALFVGQWAPTFLILGLYNKLVKQLGSDRIENQL